MTCLNVTLGSHEAAVRDSPMAAPRTAPLEAGAW